MGIFVKISMDQEALPDILKPRAISNESGKLEITWKDNSGKRNARSNDIVFVAVYEAESDKWINKSDAALRDSCCCTIKVREFGGKTVMPIIGLVSADGECFSECLVLDDVDVL
jgi:Family of unknown function (DUF6266)